MTALLFGALLVHLAGCVLLTGAFSLLLLAGPPPNNCVRRWERSVLSVARWLVAVTLASGIVWLAVRAAQFEGRSGAVFEVRSVLRAMLDTWPGHVWMLRNGLLVILGGLLLVDGDISARRDWIATRAQAFLLAALALGLQAGAGHAAAISESPWPPAIDMMHLLAASIWIGGLAPLAWLLYVASRGGATPDRYVVRVMQRFSRVALVCVFLLAGSGTATAWLLVGDIAGLVATTHGHLLLAKLAVLVLALLLAAANRALLPALASPDRETSSATARRMALFIALESLLVLLLLAFAAAMTVTVPGIHGDPIWPWSFRLSLAASPDIPALQRLVQLPAAAVLVSFGAALLIAVALRHRRSAVFMGAAFILIASGAVIAIPPMLVEAYPTSFATPLIAYHAGSIAPGMALYKTHCQSCHGRLKAGQSAAGLLAPQTTRRSAGELYWLIMHGRTERGMPEFKTQLTEAEGWHLVNFLRAIDTTVDPRRIGTKVDVDNAWLAAPDFTITVGPLTPKSLRDYRGQRMVLLVLYDLPHSRDRMADLARHYGLLSVLGVEVIAVSSYPSPNAIAELGASPPVLFPVVTDGAQDIANAYRLWAPGIAHTEVLIDRQGYIRAIWRSDTSGMPDAAEVQAQVEILNQEKAPPPLPDDHVH